MTVGSRLFLPILLILILLASVSGLSMGEVHAAVSARDLSAQALEECQKGRLAQARETRLAHFDRSQALAERAVALDDRLADGHFATKPARRWKRNR